MPLLKLSAGGPQFDGILIVAGDAGGARDVLLVLKLRSHQSAQTAEVIAGVKEEVLVDAMRPVDVRIQAERVGGVDEAEEVDGVGADALEIECP